jgi:lysine 2,3-aminomutase
VHCRHCFRKRLVGRAEAVPDGDALSAAVDWIAGERDLREVILTGGDPLTLSDDRLLALLRQLDALEHIVSLRIHSRMLVVNPFRITAELAAGLGSLTTPVVLVTHANHGREVTNAFTAAAARLRARDVDVLNQSVLLAGINDDPDVHRELLFALMAARVRPYALHHADLVPGTAHRRTSVATGQALMASLRGRVPGWALPRYLLDVPGGHGKVPVEPQWARDAGDGWFELRAPDGTLVRYDGTAPD